MILLGIWFFFTNFAYQFEYFLFPINCFIMEKIDELDKKILKIITQNARIPFRDVADQCGLSRAAVHQRVQRMYDIGVITGSGFFVNPKMLGFNLSVYVGITLEKGSLYNSVISELEKIPEVVESQFTLGGFSVLIKLYARDDAHLMHLLNSQIQEIPGVAKTETLTSLEQRIRRGLPISLEEWKPNVSYYSFVWRLVHAGW